MNIPESVAPYWAKFLVDTNRDADTPLYSVFHFCANERSANELGALVLAGKKLATSSAMYSYEITGERPPMAGDLSIITDWSGVPLCVIETTATVILPFRDITFDICLREGEDDCLESWRRNHEKFFSEEGAGLGYKFGWDMPVLFEDFREVYR